VARTAIALIAAATVVLAVASPAAAKIQPVEGRYMVVLQGSGQARASTLGAVDAAGGVVLYDLSRQVGVLVVASTSPLFASSLRALPGVAEVGQDFKVKSFDAVEAAAESVPGGGPQAHADPLEPMQWDMAMIRTPQAHVTQAGSRAVQVGILDSGIDGDHVDFVGADGSNVDCALGRDFVALGPGIGVPDPCTDNQTHGTHVAGTVGARANGVGIVGVAPNVTLVPVKVCDAEGYCYSSSTVAGITYAGDARLEVINMSFFVDDDEFQESTEFKCMDDPTQRAFRQAVERAIGYARNRGVTPVAALGNSDEDLAHPSEPNENNCDVVPAETQGVVGTMALGNMSQKAGYSNYGTGATDVAAPGGTANGDCTRGVPSTIPGGLYACLQGTSMASPHAAGVAALIVSQFGVLRADGDVDMSPTRVEQYLQGTAIDIGLAGYDECFGNGRIDALRAVTHDTSAAYDASAPFCPEYEE
jgi:lantibiotic leader peptide-processing serine protease